MEPTAQKCAAAHRQVSVECITLRVTPAMEAGLADHVWSIEEIIARKPTANLRHGMSAYEKK